MGLIPVIYQLWEDNISLFSSWIGRMEFGDFFIASSLFIACVALDIRQNEEVLSAKTVKRTINSFLAIEIVVAFTYLISDIDHFWTATLVIYDVMSIVVFGMLLIGILGKEEKNSGTIATLVLFIMAFVLSFAIFYSEEIFYIAVVTYYIAIIVYYSTNYARLLNNKEEEKEEKEEE